MPYIGNWLRLAAACAAAWLMAAPGIPAAAADAALPELSSGDGPLPSPQTLHRGEGKSFVSLDASGKLVVAATNGAVLAANATPAADASLLRLLRWGGLRPHAIWIGQNGIRLVALDAGAASVPQSLALPGRGGAARVARVTRLAIVESSSGPPTMLAGDRSGGVTSLAIEIGYGAVRLRPSGYWSVGGPVTDIIVKGSRAWLAATTGVWRLDLDDPEAAPVLDDGGACIFSAPEAATITTGRADHRAC